MAGCFMELALLRCRPEVSVFEVNVYLAPFSFHAIPVSPFRSSRSNLLLLWISQVFFLHFSDSNWKIYFTFKSSWNNTESFRLSKILIIKTEKKLINLITAKNVLYICLEDLEVNILKGYFIYHILSHQ